MPSRRSVSLQLPLTSVALSIFGGWQVRRALQRLPLGPDESHSIVALEERAAALRARAEELRAQTVPRPQPSQYPALQQELARFMHNLGSVQRIAALLQALQVSLHQCLCCPGVSWTLNRHIAA